MTSITRGTEKQIAFAEAIIAEIEAGKRRYDFRGKATPMEAFEVIRASAAKAAPTNAKAARVAARAEEIIALWTTLEDHAVLWIELKDRSGYALTYIMDEGSIAAKAREMLTDRIAS
mgnify:CR=1 FL=1